MSKIQSVSDIITNSSSEVFIVSANHHDIIEQVLRDICEVCGWDIDDMMTFTSAEEDGKIEWWGNKYKAGDLLIRSTSDNTIPYPLMVLIEELQWASMPVLDRVEINDIQRIHLG